jgi:hypothetical protein
MTAEIVCLEHYRRAVAGASVSSSPLLEKRPFERGEGMAAMLRRQERRWVDHRDGPRHHVQGTCAPSVTVNGQAARLEDVSSTGLKVRAEVDARLGANLVVAIAGCPSLLARLIWIRDGVMGLEAPMASMSLLAI